MYVSDTDYHYIVSYSDNYVILAKRGSVSADWNNTVNLPVMVQYFQPSFVSFETTRTFNTSQSFTSVDVSDDFYDRADCNSILASQFIIILICIFVLNGLSRFVRKGGVFFGN